MHKFILITGSTDGIGKLAALKLARDGHAVMLHGRNQEKLNRVIAEVKAASNNEKVKGFVADFSDLVAVRKMAEEVSEGVAKIDVLINNAGVFKSPIAVNKEGLDLRFVVNYFAPYVLTSALMPLLNKGADTRVINLSSAAQASISHEALAGQSSLSVQAAYAQSKLAITMWSFYLARMAPNLAVIAVNPGSLLNTNMVKEAYGRYWSSADKGADILYDLAVSDGYEGITEKYFDNDRGMFGEAHTDAYDDREIDKLMATTNRIVVA